MNDIKASIAELPSKVAARPAARSGRPGNAPKDPRRILGSRVESSRARPEVGLMRPEDAVASIGFTQGKTGVTMVNVITRSLTIEYMESEGSTSSLGCRLFHERLPGPLPP